MAIESIGLYPISVDVYEKMAKTTVKANEGDINGRGLLITLIKNKAPFNSTGISLKLAFRNAIGEERLYDCTVVDALEGKYSVLYPTELTEGNANRVVKTEIKAYEDVSGALLTYSPIYVYVEESVVTEGEILATQEGSTLQKMIDDVTYVQNELGNLDPLLIEDAVTLANTIEPLELERQSNEDKRILNETGRTSGENARTNAESLRAIAENGRESAETIRELGEDARVNSESARATSEGQRVTAESGRVTTESARVLAENSRVSAESNRTVAESSRVTAESGRVSAEGARNTNETTRESQESARVIAEEGRVDAESARNIKEGQRETAEAARVNAENTRIQNDYQMSYHESLRYDAEVIREANEDARILSESERVTAEETRATFYDGFSAQLNETAQRIDNLVATPVPTGEIIAEEIIDARDGEVSVGAKIRSVDAQLAQKVSQGEVTSADLKILTDSDKIQLIHLSEQVKQAIAGTTSINASVADGIVTPEKTSFMKVLRTNLFDKTKAVVGVVNQATGAIEGTNYRVTDFIPVKEGRSYVTNGTYDSGYYDINKQFVQGFKPSNGASFSIPTELGISYVRIGFNTPLLDTLMFVEGTNLPSNYTPYTDYSIDINGTEVIKAIENISNNLPVPLSKLDYLFKEKRTNLFDKTKAVTGVVDQTTGAIKGTLYKVSDFIPVAEGNNYITQTNYDSGYYDSNKNFVQGFKPSANTPFIVPTGLDIKYARIGLPSGLLDTLMFVEGTDLPVSYVPYDYWGVVFATEDQKEIFKNELGISGNSLYGLKFNFIGDSITGITYGKPYHQWISERTGLIARNYGVNGSCIAVRDGVSNSILERHSSMNIDADGVIVFGGRNDKTNGVPIGSMNDRVNNTVYGACHLLFTSLLESYPKKKIGIILPLQRNGEELSSILAYNDAIKEVAEYYSLPVLDLLRSGGLSPNLPSNVTNYMPDGLHPNSDGQEIISRRIEAFLLTI